MAIPRGASSMTTYGAILLAAGITLSAHTWARADEMKREMVFIPAGEFTIGTSQEEVDALAAEYGVHPSLFAIEMPKRTVDLKSFLIDRYPATGNGPSHRSTARARPLPATLTTPASIRGPSGPTCRRARSGRWLGSCTSSKAGRRS